MTKHKTNYSHAISKLCGLCLLSEFIVYFLVCNLFVHLCNILRILRCLLCLLMNRLLLSSNSLILFASFIICLISDSLLCCGDSWNRRMLGIFVFLGFL